MDWKVQLFKLNYGEEELQAVVDTIESGWITMGQRTIDFETAFSAYLGEGYRGVAVSSGTAALHIGVIACDIYPGDEVIVPSLTFIADLNVVRAVGGMPVLADIKSLTDWSMDPEDIEAKITKNTKAILIVHYAGYACDMEAISEITRKHHLKLIEDCAHAPGADYKGKRLGTFGEISAWSFFTNKNISVGEGGMVATSDPELYERCRYLRSHGMTVATLDRIKGRAETYEVVEPGFNYRIDEMRAALGVVQLKKLEEANKRREELTKRYFMNLQDVDGVILPFKDFDRGLPSYHIMPILLSEDIDRQTVIQNMKEAGVQTSIHYPAIQSFKAYRELVNPTPKAQYVSEHELTLPLYPTMTDDEVDLVCTTLQEAIHSTS